MSVDTSKQNEEKDSNLEAEEEKEEQVSLLMIVKNIVRYEATAKFLERRGWPCKIVTSVGDAIKYAIAESPSFVLISMSIDNPKVLQLPKLLAQNFNCTTIAFGESHNFLTTKRLKNCKCQHVMHENVSGPSVHRRIQSILMEKNQPDLASNNNEEASSNTGSSFVSIKGGDSSSFGDMGSGMTRISSTESSSNITVRGGNQDYSSSPSSAIQDLEKNYQLMSRSKLKTLDDLSKSMYHDPNAEKSELSNRSQSEKEYMGLNPNSSQPNTNGNQNPAHSSSTNGSQNPQFNSTPQSTQESSSALGSRSGNQNNSQMGSGSLNPNSSQMGSPSSSENGSSQEGLSGFKNNEAEGGINGTNHQSNDVQSSQKNSQQKESSDALKSSMSGSGNENSNRSSSNENARQQYPWERKNKEAKKDGSKRKLTEAEEIEKIKKGMEEHKEGKPYRPLQRAIETALKNTCEEPGKKATVTPLNLAQKQELIAIRSDQFNGYLSVFYPKNTMYTEKFLVNFRSALMQELAFQAKDLSVDTSLKITTKPTPLYKWVNDYMKFGFSREHKDIEVCTAFFESNNIFKGIYNIFKNMAEVELNTLIPDKKLKFNLFLYLKENNKFYLYVKKNRMLSSKQKENLMANNVDVMHIKEEEIESYKEYVAENYFNDTIDEFNNKSLNEKKSDITSEENSEDNTSQEIKKADKKAA